MNHYFINLSHTLASDRESKHFNAYVSGSRWMFSLAGVRPDPSREIHSLGPGKYLWEMKWKKKKYS